jgi:hypothetical protein
MLPSSSPARSVGPPPPVEPATLSTGQLKIRIQVPRADLRRRNRDGTLRRSSLPAPITLNDVARQANIVNSSLGVLAGNLSTLTDRVDLMTNRVGMALHSMTDEVKNTRAYIHSLEADEKIGRQRNDLLEEDIRTLKRQNVGTTSQLSSTTSQLSTLLLERALLKVENASRTTENAEIYARLAALEAKSTRRKTF